MPGAGWAVYERATIIIFQMAVASEERVGSKTSFGVAVCVLVYLRYRQV